MSPDWDASVFITLLWLAWICSHIWIVMGGSSDVERRTDNKRGATGWHGRKMNEPELDGLVDNRRLADLASVRWSEVLVEIERRDASFMLPVFLGDALASYEIITAAFACGDRESLQALVSPEVYRVFLSAIVERECAHERTETTLVHAGLSQISDVRVIDDRAEIAIRFVGEFQKLTRISGEQGNSKVPAVLRTTCADLWTFSKSLGSRDTGWWLVATEPG